MIKPRKRKTVYQKEQHVHGMYCPSNYHPQRYDYHSQMKYTYWPRLLAHMVMDYLYKKMNPDDTIARVEFNNAYKNISMKKMITQPTFLNK